VEWLLTKTSAVQLVSLLSFTGEYIMSSYTCISSGVPHRINSFFDVTFVHCIALLTGSYRPPTERTWEWLLTETLAVQLVSLLSVTGRKSFFDTMFICVLLPPTRVATNHLLTTLHIHIHMHIMHTYP